MSLKEVFCQDKAIGILQRAFGSGKMPHAYIFAGREGVGRFSTARQWAKMLLCKKPVVENDFADSCGSCESCRLFEAGSHPDFHHIYKELLEFTENGKGKTTPVEVPIHVIREFLIDKAPNRPTLSQAKVFVVSEAEKLNRFSQNALLKVLEEPPEYCCLILLCTRIEKLLPTTKSRCQIIRFGIVAEDRIIRELKEMGLEEAQAQYFARLAQGSLGQAHKWAGLELSGAGLYSTKKELLGTLANCVYADALDSAEWILGECKAIASKWSDLDKATSKTDVARRVQKTLLQMVVSAFHDAMKSGLADTEALTNFDQMKHIRDLAERFDSEQCAGRITDCHRAMREIESNVNEKLIFEQLLLNLTSSDTIRV